MKTTHLLLSIPLALLVVSGCTSDELLEKSQINEKGEYAVRFSGNMDMTLTKANTTDVATGVKATISAYTKDDDVTSNTAIVSNGYTVGQTAGTFEGDADFVMYLPKGNYDFYAVSTNSATAAPTFTSGVSGDLENGVDYIYAKTASQSVGNGEKNIALEFSRKAVQIYIDIKSDEAGLELTSWQSGDNAATITPPVVTGCTMALTDGTITAANSVDTELSNGFYKGNMTQGSIASKNTTASYIMLPVETGKTLKVQFKVNVKIGDRTAEAKTYTADLTAPSQDPGASTAFLSGKKYTYTATLKANKITFTGATVADWTTVNTTDDLNPTEPAS